MTLLPMDGCHHITIYDRLALLCFVVIVVFLSPAERKFLSDLFMAVCPAHVSAMQQVPDNYP